jgi:isocitrate dehydrogenase
MKIFEKQGKIEVKGFSVIRVVPNIWRSINCTIKLYLERNKCEEPLGYENQFASHISSYYEIPKAIQSSFLLRTIINLYLL